MTQKKCKDKKAGKIIVKDQHNYQCKKCGRGAKKEEKLCKPEKISRLKR